MRTVFIGAGEVTVYTAERILKQGGDVIIIESDRERINELSETLDCSFIHGDGGAPHVLREAGPELTDVLLCLTDNDRDNIIASLVGRSLGFSRIITRIENPEYIPVCNELGLGNVIVPSQTISRYLADMVMGVDVLELSSVIKGEARLFSFVVPSNDVGSVADLDLPGESRVICLYRDERFELPEADTRLRKGDEVVVLTRVKDLPALHERWEPKYSPGPMR